VLATNVQKIAFTIWNCLQAAILPPQSLVPGLLLLQVERPNPRTWSADDPLLSPPGEPAMKKTLFAFCLLFSTAALAQNFVGGSVISTQPFIPSLPDHPAHASYAPIASGQSVLVGGSFSSAQGERPVSDFPQPEAISLGTAARELRKEHAQLKKAKAVWVNQ
jgi:hypothetical protein